MASLDPRVDFELVEIKSHGDMASYHQNGFIDPGVFVKKLEKALLANEVDLAVHSLKDMPVALHPRLKLALMLERETCRDVFVFLKDKTSWFHKKTGCLATSSVRRAFFMTRKFPRLKVKKIRGNINSRIEKLRRGECDFLILSKVGFLRLNLNSNDLVIKDVPLEWLLPAPAQGVIAVETLGNNHGLNDWLQQLDHWPTRRSVRVEREIMKSLECGCNSPIGCLVQREGHGEVGHYFIQISFVPNFKSDENKWQDLKILNVNEKIPDNDLGAFLERLKKLV